MSYFQEDIVNCNQNCDICTSNLSDAPMDYTAIARTIIQALASLSRIPQNVSVKLFTQFLFGSTSNVVKKLALDRIDGYGSVSKTFGQRDGRKTCQRLIYKLITLGIITETPSGTNERPAITISIGNQLRLTGLAWVNKVFLSIYLSNNPSPLSDNSLTIMY
jgi:superfamily II DNA helicase RecQ